MRRKMLIVLLLLSVTAHAQHMFEIGAHVGAAGWSAERDYIATNSGVHAGGHMYYNYLSPYIIGFRTGLTFDCHNAGFGKVNYEDAYSTIDVDNEQMDISYSIGNLRERYTYWSVGVPVQLAWNYDRFTLYTGVKAVLPLTCSRKQTVSHAALSVYYPAYDNRIEESYPLAASRDFDMQSADQSRPFRESLAAGTNPVQWWLALELNYSLPLRIWSRKSRPYVIVGLYFDYCLTQYTPTYSDNPSMIMLSDTRDGLPLQRTLTPVVSSMRQGSPLVNRYGLFDVGVKISYAISSYTPPKRKFTKRCRCDK